MTELLLCPFCGGEAKHYTKPGRYPLTFIECQACEARSGIKKNKAEAIATWNTRTPIEYDGWFYLPKPKEGIVNYGEPSITKTENGYKVRQLVDVVDEAARKWGDELGEYIMRRICEVWNSRAERTCKNISGKNWWAFECSECGEMIEQGVPEYCPSCGAKVVGE